MSKYDTYKGYATISFPIERVKDPVTGAWRELKNDDPEEIEIKELVLSIEGYSYYDPGQCSGPPEKCYPPEGETSIVQITAPDGKTWSEDDLTEDEISCILQDIEIAVEKTADYGRDPDDFYDRDDDVIYYIGDH